MNRTKYSATVKQTDQKSLYSYNSTEDDSSTYNFEINEGSKFSDHFGLLGTCWKKTFGQIKGDWVFLTLLGSGHGMDFIICRIYHRCLCQLPSLFILYDQRSVSKILGLALHPRFLNRVRHGFDQIGGSTSGRIWNP
ncbi:hypothetical protein Avbf_06787 [Armadillidium vulgare]|nr:hypothetical protein Avbf_06787 [Armadillidium vulgare]